MKITIGDYVIRPYQNGLCWTIDVWAEVRKLDGSSQKELLSTKRFPTSLKGAIEMVADMSLLESSKDVKAIEDISAAIRELKDELLGKITVSTASK